MQHVILAGGDGHGEQKAPGREQEILAGRLSFLNRGRGFRDRFSSLGTINQASGVGRDLRVTAGIDQIADRTRRAQGDPGIRLCVPSPVDDGLGAGD